MALQRATQASKQLRHLSRQLMSPKGRVPYSLRRGRMMTSLIMAVGLGSVNSMCQILLSSHTVSPSKGEADA